MKISHPIRPVYIAESRWRYVPHLAIVAALWILAMSLDYADELAAERAKSARIDAEHTACLRGEWRAITEQGVEIGCLPVQLNHPLRKS